MAGDHWVLCGSEGGRLSGLALANHRGVGGTPESTCEGTLHEEVSLGRLLFLELFQGRRQTFHLAIQFHQGQTVFPIPLPRIPYSGPVRASFRRNWRISHHRFIQGIEDINEFCRKQCFRRKKGRLSLCCRDRNCQFYWVFPTWGGLKIRRVSHNFSICDQTVGTGAV